MATSQAGWTIAYRKPRANKFHRVPNVHITWEQATNLASLFAALHPTLQVYYVADKESEDAGFVSAEDVGNILTVYRRNGRHTRVRMTETGTLGGASLPTIDSTPTPEKLEDMGLTHTW